jgi:hypothetical protein
MLAVSSAARIGRACLVGWPTLVALRSTGTSSTARRDREELQGHLMPEHGREDITGLPVVILRHGERADAVFGGTDNFDLRGTGRCPSFYRHLRVTPQGNSRSVRLSAWLPWLGGYLPGCWPISVSMVVARSEIYHG